MLACEHTCAASCQGRTPLHIYIFGGGGAQGCTIVGIILVSSSSGCLCYSSTSHLGITHHQAPAAAACRSTRFRGHASGRFEACCSTHFLIDDINPTLHTRQFSDDLATWWERVTGVMTQRAPVGCAASLFPISGCCYPPLWSAMLPGAASPSPTTGADAPATSQKSKKKRTHQLLPRSKKGIRVALFIRTLPQLLHL